MSRILLFIAALCLPSPALAGWKAASSRHFIVYSDGEEKQLRQAVTDLEKYWFVLRFVTGAKPQAKPIKIKVYLMRNAAVVVSTMGAGGSGGVAGYYTANERGPIAVGTRNDTGGEYGLEAQLVLFHELAHHYMFQHFPAAYPSWYVEGFADYYGATQLLPNEVVEVGRPLKSRYASIAFSEWMPVSKLLTAKSYADVEGRLGQLYSQGWLLVHYLTTTAERKGQLKQYLDAINAGQSYETAASGAFGDLKKLDGELRRYSGRASFPGLRLPFKPIDVGMIDVRQLSPAEDALIMHDIALGRGIFRRDAAEFASDVRRSVARFPNDLHALRLLTEAERAAGNRDAALAAAARWHKADPASGLALMHKAELDIEALVAARSTDEEAWDTARAQMITASKLTRGEPQILLSYYESFKAQGKLPPAAAQNALVEAFKLVPQADMLRHMVATDFEARGMIDTAITIIKPAAYQLHSDENDPKKKKRAAELREKYREVGDTRTETALEMLTRLEKKHAEQKGGASN